MWVKVGDIVNCNGYRGQVVSFCGPRMANVRLPRGETCVGIEDLLPYVGLQTHDAVLHLSHGRGVIVLFYVGGMRGQVEVLFGEGYLAVDVSSLEKISAEWY